MKQHLIVFLIGSILACGVLFAAQKEKRKANKMEMCVYALSRCIGPTSLHPSCKNTRLNCSGFMSDLDFSGYKVMPPPSQGTMPVEEKGCLLKDWTGLKWVCRK